MTFHPNWGIRPGEFVEEFLEDRDWSSDYLAQMMGVETEVVSKLLDGTTPISPDLARQLGQIFGTSARLWLNLEIAWQEFKQREP